RRHTIFACDWSSDVCSSDLTTAHPLVVVHVSAGNPFRRWPRESFEALVIALARRDPSRRIILTAGPSDAAAAKAIADGARTALRSEERRVGKWGEAGGRAPG